MLNNITSYNNPPKIGDKVVVQTHFEGKKICVVDRIDNKKNPF